MQQRLAKETPVCDPWFTCLFREGICLYRFSVIMVVLIPGKKGDWSSGFLELTFHVSAKRLSSELSSKNFQWPSFLALNTSERTLSPGLSRLQGHSIEPYNGPSCSELAPINITTLLGTHLVARTTVGAVCKTMEWVHQWNESLPGKAAVALLYVCYKEEKHAHTYQGTPAWTYMHLAPGQ